MGPLGPAPAHVPAGCKSAWEGNEVTGSVQCTFGEDLPWRKRREKTDTEKRREKTNNGVDFGVPGVSDHYTHPWVTPEH